MGITTRYMTERQAVEATEKFGPVVYGCGENGSNLTGVTRDFALSKNIKKLDQKAVEDFGMPVAGCGDQKMVEGFVAHQKAVNANVSDKMFEQTMANKPNAHKPALSGSSGPVMA